MNFVVTFVQNIRMHRGAADGYEKDGIVVLSRCADLMFPKETPSHVFYGCTVLSKQNIGQAKLDNSKIKT